MNSPTCSGRMGCLLSFRGTEASCPGSSGWRRPRDGGRQSRQLVAGPPPWVPSCLLSSSALQATHSPVPFLFLPLVPASLALFSIALFAFLLSCALEARGGRLLSQLRLQSVGCAWEPVWEEKKQWREGASRSQCSQPGSSRSGFQTRMLMQKNPLCFSFPQATHPGAFKGGF